MGDFMKTRAALLGATALIALTVHAANATTHRVVLSLEGGAISSDWGTLRHHHPLHDGKLFHPDGPCSALSARVPQPQRRLEIESDMGKQLRSPHEGGATPTARSPILSARLGRLTGSASWPVSVDIPLGASVPCRSLRPVGSRRFVGVRRVCRRQLPRWPFAYQGIVRLLRDRLALDLFLNYR